ncbi:hypothetical protein LTS17_003596 [Exophiala oligosperma]
MAEFTFTPSPATLSAEALNTKSTVARVVFYPSEIYVDAQISPPAANPNDDNSTGPWRAKVQTVPRQAKVALDEQTVMLLLTKGEFGKEIGRVEAQQVV